jgi:DNA-binding transcriptional LysR family regulator
MDRLDSFIVFARVLETGNFSSVARELGLSQPTISRIVAGLESHLGVQLFARSTRRLTPTTDALRIFDHVRDMLEAHEAIRVGVTGKLSEPGGLLRVTMPSSFGNAEIVPHLREFMGRYPKVKLDLKLTDHVVDLIEEGSEVAIRIGNLGSSNLIARRLGTVQRRVLASRDYLEREREPLTPEDLAAHNCIVYAGLAEANSWTFDSDYGRRTTPVAGTLSVDNADAMAKAVRAGIGIALLPYWLLQEEIESGEVRILLQEYEPTALPINAVYASGRWLSHRARAFIDFLAERLGTAEGGR